MDKPFYNPEIWGGIECTINRVNQHFFDQLQYAGHYDRKGDLCAIAQLGIKKIRYPILWEKHQPESDTQIDWSWTQQQLQTLRDYKINVIAGLVHHGSGPSFTKLSDKNFPNLLASYAGEVARQFPWIEYYTPVNEPLTTARFSGLYGIWFPHHKNARCFMQMLLHQLKGVVLSMQEIRKVNPNAKLVQTEDLGKTYSTPKLAYQAKFENERRWLTYDILCGKFAPGHRLWKFFQKLSIPVEEYEFFMQHPCVPDIFGFNHYLTSERYLDDRMYLYPDHTHGGNKRHHYADVEAVRVQLDEKTGLETLLLEAWERYHQPIAITEVHLHCHREEQLRWFKEVWETGKRLLEQKVDLRAITSWALLGSYGWNQLLTQPKGSYEPGAFDLRSGHPRPTALANFISTTAKDQVCEHHLSEEKGWWKRSTRLIYDQEPVTFHMTSNNSFPVLIIGKNGTLGRAFAKVCETRCIHYRLLGRQECDISNPLSINQAILHFKPWAIINAAGFVRVDDAEREHDACLRDNTTGPFHLATACNQHGIPLLTFSSDLVFDGQKTTPYKESDVTGPLNFYGLSKQRSEILVSEAFPASLIVRTSAFFGPWDEFNFVYHIRRALARYEVVPTANDLIVSPTYVPHLVHAALDLLIDREKGIWHLANQGALTWTQLAYLIADKFDLDKQLIHPISADQLHFSAKRPPYSVLGSEHGQLLPPFEMALEEYFRRMVTENRKVA